MASLAVVTGASGGIGEALARLLAADGHDLVLVARSTGPLQTLGESLARQHGIDARPLTVDLSVPDAADAVAAALGSRLTSVDILVNNAGFATLGPFARADPDQQRQLLRVNIETVTMLTRHVVPGMIERRRGRVLNVASTAAFLPGPLMATYYASKAYVLSFSEALANETEGFGVTVTCLAPGPTRSGFQGRAGIERTRLLRVSTLMSAEEVARAGYDGMMAGRTLVIPGLMNKIGAFSTRLAPRTLLPRIVRRLHGEQ